jgi:hypothetical protein
MVRRDHVGTPAQRCGNSDGDESRRLLVDAAHRMSPLARNTSKTSRRPRRCCSSRRGASDEPVEGLAERLETRRVVLQLGAANLGDVLDVACARFSRGGRRADGGAAVEGAPRAVGGVFAGGRCGRRGAAPAAGRRSGGGAGDARRAAAGADPRRGVGVDGRGAAVARARPRPARGIAYVAGLAARGLDAALAGVRRPVLAIERVAELE